MPPSPTTTRRSLLLTAFGLAATLALAPLLGACSKKSPRLQSLPAGATVLAFGDSVTYGTGAQAGQDWPSLLAGLSGWNVINAGIAGDTATVKATFKQFGEDAEIIWSLEKAGDGWKISDIASPKNEWKLTGIDCSAIPAQ